MDGITWEVLVVGVGLAGLVLRMSKRLDRLEDRLTGVEKGLAKIEGLIEGWKTVQRASSDAPEMAAGTGSGR